MKDYDEFLVLGFGFVLLLLFLFLVVLGMGWICMRVLSVKYV